ncbi:MAG: DUF3124 domain-containing protein [Cyclobacteriaceae bacterium]
MITKSLLSYLIVISSLLVYSCTEPNPNRNTYSEKVLKQNEVGEQMPLNHEYIDSVYVPVYSDIYSRSKKTHFLLTVTLSIRNTSYTDTLIIRTIDYFNTQGDLVKEYLDEPIYLNPMASIDYVIDEKDDSGGSGANFIVVWSAKNAKVNPIIQAVMISTNGQQGVAFTTEGVSILK